MKLIGLTGNIASGKSTVASLLVGLGAAHLDADALVHELYRADTPVTGAVAARYGERVLAADGSIDRRALGELVFTDPDAMRELEQIVHPRVGELTAARVQEVASQSEPPPALVIEAVKLIESGRYKIVEQVWFVIARPEVQKQRLLQRGWSEAEAQARLHAQAPIKERMHYADVIIENSGSLETLERQVRSAWQNLFAGVAGEDTHA